MHTLPDLRVKTSAMPHYEYSCLNPLASHDQRKKLAGCHFVQVRAERRGKQTSKQAAGGSDWSKNESMRVMRVMLHWVHDVHDPNSTGEFLVLGVPVDTLDFQMLGSSCCCQCYMIS